MTRLPLILALLAAGCTTVGPDYAAPTAPLPAAYVGRTSAAAADLSTRPWWQDYGDAMLAGYVAQGLDANLDVAAAVERIRQAQANLRTTGLNAQLSGPASLDATRSGGEGLSASTTGAAGLSAGYVIDLFGGVERGRQSAQASLIAARADVETARLAWLASLVSAYSDARYYQEALELARETIAAREETVRITARQRELGAATDYEVAEAQALLDSARAAQPQYLAGFNANVFAIAALLDRPAGPILAQMQPGAPQLRVPAAPGAGAPADLLRARPDVRSAEAAYAAAVYDVGVAEAELYPSLELSGSISLSTDVSTWAFGPTLTIPVLNRGTLEASRDAALSLAEQARIAWRASVNGAVQDVQTSLSTLAQQRRRTAALRQAAESYGRALSLAQETYRAGAITLLDLLDTDRSTAAARILAASAANDAAKEWATLQISLGAGAAAPQG